MLKCINKVSSVHAGRKFILWAEETAVFPDVSRSAISSGVREREREGEKKKKTSLFFRLSYLLINISVLKYLQKGYNRFKFD